MIEILAAITTLVCVILLNVKNIWGWPVGIIAAGLYSFVFFEVELYSQVILQCIFILQSIAGWFYWKRDGDSVKIKSSNDNRILLSVLYITAAIWFFWLFSVFMWVDTYDIADVFKRGFDLFTVGLALYANYLLSLKILQSWKVWILCDIFMIGFMISLGLWWSAGLYVLLLINASIALRNWTKEYKLQKNGKT